MQNPVSKKPEQTRKAFIKLSGYLSKKRKSQLLLLFMVMILSGVAELITLGLFVPFLSALSDPDKLWEIPTIRTIANYTNMSNSSELIIPLTLLFTLAAIFSTFIRLLNLRLNCQLAASIGSDISCEVFKRTIYKPYAFHVRSNSSSLISGIATNLNRTVAAINGFLQLMTSLIVAIGLFIGLLLINWKLAVGTGVLFGSIYSYIALTSRIKLKFASNKIANLAEQQIKIIQEGLGAIREVILGNNQVYYLEKYKEIDVVYRGLLANNKFISAYPRYSIEGTGLVIMALIGGILALQKGNGNETVLTLLGALALGAQRLLPALQQIYGSWSNIKGFSGDLSKVLYLLRQPIVNTPSNLNPIGFTEKITLENISFSYSLHEPDVLKGVSMEIYNGDRIGIIGGSGSGKSTITDIIMGLLEPTKGRIFVDNVDLYDSSKNSVRQWQDIVTHVPQSIYLSDNTIAENIAFGIPYDEIDHARVKEAAKQAEIDKFIQNSLGGYESIVGERGMRLSGGQRQRIAIARALYKKAQVMVFDEATSALDVDTETAVMAGIEGLSDSLTIIIIAHRLSTTKCCNRVFSLNNGALMEM